MKICYFLCTQKLNRRYSYCLDICANPEPGADPFKSTDAHAIPIAIHLLTEVVQGAVLE
jgi:hypothetical protein